MIFCFIRKAKKTFSSVEPPFFSNLATTGRDAREASDHTLGLSRLILAVRNEGKGQAAVAKLAPFCQDGCRHRCLEAEPVRERLGHGLCRARQHLPCPSGPRRLQRGLRPPKRARPRRDHPSRLVHFHRPPPAPRPQGPARRRPQAGPPHLRVIRGLSPRTPLLLLTAPATSTLSTACSCPSSWASSPSLIWRAAFGHPHQRRVAWVHMLFAASQREAKRVSFYSDARWLATTPSSPASRTPTITGRPHRLPPAAVNGQLVRRRGARIITDAAMRGDETHGRFLSFQKMVPRVNPPSVQFCPSVPPLWHRCRRHSDAFLFSRRRSSTRRRRKNLGAVLAGING
ncbi:hypothetical protein K438DRAFT_657090 [Mycena galopus ATCC 62051]|nr:hypothetical protein K438DRAFT_657090 [Mycena galopus ATCC 62051]